MPEFAFLGQHDRCRSRTDDTHFFFWHIASEACGCYERTVLHCRIIHHMIKFIGPLKMCDKNRGRQDWILESRPVNPLYKESLYRNYSENTRKSLRRGRAGRVKDGNCYCLYTENRFNELMCSFQLPEILRAPLVELCLQIKLLSGGELEKALDPCKTEAVESALSILREGGARAARQFCDASFLSMPVLN
ncbi:hypothetical protein SELMODRAFT_431942 [Selaginella moellendorffii]|uniref:Uncharacterized protein n=1 Tax=Selaginella moellendorffii TaxID=88036 RepID=D8TEG3_SELML|nr:hypothetical protein SELMODRAFT_431942 [Selaginella moellendorffii]